MYTNGVVSVDITDPNFIHTDVYQYVYILVYLSLSVIIAINFELTRPILVQYVQFAVIETGAIISAFLSPAFNAKIKPQLIK